MMSASDIPLRANGDSILADWLNTIRAYLIQSEGAALTLAMDTVSRDALVSPQVGQIIFNTDLGTLEWFTGAGWENSRSHVVGSYLGPVTINGGATVSPGSATRHVLQFVKSNSDISLNSQPFSDGLFTGQKVQLVNSGNFSILISGETKLIRQGEFLLKPGRVFEIQWWGTTWGETYRSN